MLASDWLIRMIEKSGAHPRVRLLSIFDILHDWVEAPGIRDTLAKDPSALDTCQPLLGYLAAQARACHSAYPEALAHQIYFIALGALHEELRTPRCGALLQARRAAATLLAAPRQHRMRSGSVLRQAAVMALLIVGIGLWSSADSPATVTTAPLAPTRILDAHNQTESPLQVAALYTAMEKIRTGVCQYPQALMLPPEQRAAYLDVVVGGAIPLGSHSPQELQKLVQQVDCYYAPVALVSS